MRGTTIRTLGDLKARGDSISAHCGNPNCGHYKLLDLDMLIARFGADYVFINETRIKNAVRCEICERKGGKLIFGPAATTSAYRKAKGG